MSITCISGKGQTEADRHPVPRESIRCSSCSANWRPCPAQAGPLMSDRITVQRRRGATDPDIVNPNERGPLLPRTGAVTASPTPVINPSGPFALAEHRHPAGHRHGRHRLSGLGPEPIIQVDMDQASDCHPAATICLRLSSLGAVD